MSPEAQQIAIETACGWTRVDIGLNPGASGKNLFTIGSSRQGTPPEDKDKPEDDQAYERVPDFLHDLNATFQFVEHLRDKGWSIEIEHYFNGWSVKLVSDGKNHYLALPKDDLSTVICQCGLTALNLWTDTK